MDSPMLSRRETVPAHSSCAPPLRLLAVLVALGIVVTLAVVPGVFTVDENNYLANVVALRRGHVTVTNTQGLTPSRELLFFDPAPWSRTIRATPAASTAPPLYAAIALPFSWFGWRGLVALNTLSYLATALMVFVFARRYASKAATPWLATVAFTLGGFALEYAGGVWPHALSFCLCTAGIFAACLAVEKSSVPPAVAAGALLGLATGVRYQNAVIVLSTGVGLLAWRWRSPIITVAFGVSASVPLSISAAINHFRLGSWNPISKGVGYLDVPLISSTGSRWMEPSILFWAHVVDFSVRPPITTRFADAWVQRDPLTGAHMILDVTAKRALVQSAPWTLLALVVLALAWSSFSRITEDQRRQLRLMSLPVLAVIATFSLAGLGRNDGLSFNERYLLELLPLTAVALSWAWDRHSLHLRHLLIGAGVSSVCALIVLITTPIVGGPNVLGWVVRQLVLLKVPIMLGAALGMAWILSARFGWSRLADVALGACLGWGMTVHLADDLMVSREIRTMHLGWTNAVAPVLHDGTALVAYWGYKESVGPILLTNDVVVLDAHVDDGADAARLIGQLLDRGRKVFVLKTGFPTDVLERVIAGFNVEVVRSGPVEVLSVTYPSTTS